MHCLAHLMSSASLMIGVQPAEGATRWHVARCSFILRLNFCLGHRGCDVSSAARGVCVVRPAIRAAHYSPSMVHDECSGPWLMARCTLCGPDDRQSWIKAGR